MEQMKRASWNLQLCVTRSEIEGPKVILLLQICRMQYEHQYVISFFELSYNERTQVIWRLDTTYVKNPL